MQNIYAVIGVKWEALNLCLEHWRVNLVPSWDSTPVCSCSKAAWVLVTGCIAPSSQFCQVILERSLFVLINQWNWGWAARNRALLPALSSCFTGTTCFLGLAPALLCTNFIGFPVSACCFPRKARGEYYMRGNLHESFHLVAHLKRTSRPKLKTWLWKSETEQCSVYIVSVQGKAARVLSKERIPNSVQIGPNRTKNLTEDQYFKYARFLTITKGRATIIIKANQFCAEENPPFTLISPLHCPSIQKDHTKEDHFGKKIKF